MKKCKIAMLLCAVALFLTALARYVEGFADGFYSYCYRPVSTLFAFIFGLFPFSVVEVLLYIVIIVVVVFICRVVYCICKKKKVKGFLLNGLENFVLTAAILFFLFVVNCGVNYHKTGFAASEGFAVSTYTKEELVSVCNILTDSINSLEGRLTQDEDGNTIVDGDKYELVKEAMKSLADTYTSLSGYYPSPKGLIFSQILSYQEVTGIYVPFTVEANFNDDVPEYTQPFTMCHELSHLKGVMREEEANFVGFLACIHSNNASLQYSGYMTAYTYCMNELYNYDVEAYKEIREKLCETANSDISNKHEFWEKYDTKIASFSNKVNNAYLKANAQVNGTASYNEVTSLILAYYNK